MDRLPFLLLKAGFICLGADFIRRLGQSLKCGEERWRRNAAGHKDMGYKCSDSVGQSPDRLWPAGKSWGAMLPAEQSRAGGYMQLAQVLCYKLYNRAECFRAG